MLWSFKTFFNDNKSFWNFIVSTMKNVCQPDVACLILFSPDSTSGAKLPKMPTRLVGCVLTFQGALMV